MTGKEHRPGYPAQREEKAAQVDDVAPSPVSVGDPAWLRRVLGVALWGGVLAAAALWPIWAPGLVAGLVLYGVVLYFWPAMVVLVVPAAVPVLDFSLLTGMEVVDEFDLLVVASIAALLTVARKGRGLPHLPPVMAFLVALFTVSVAVSSVIGWFNMAGFAAQGVSAYLSEYNILRQVKGWTLALGLFLVLPQTGYDVPTLVRRYLIPGMVLGLFFVLAVMAWERAAYPGLFDFNSTYRPTALFTDMQLGGPSIETYLVLALPFVLAWCWLRVSVMRVIVSLVLAAGGMHALWITYSRGGYLGLAVLVTVMMGLGALAILCRGGRWRAWLLAGLGVVVIAVASATGLWLQSQDGFAGHRLARIEHDLENRWDHWQSAMDLREPTFVARALGHGPGSFPQASYLSSPPERLPANFAFRQSGDTGTLVLGTGQSVYMNQRVPPVSGGVYELDVRASSDRNATLHVHLCEKHVRYSFGCVRRELSFSGEEDVQARTASLPTESLVQEGRFPPRHHVLSVRNVSGEGAIRLQELQLRSDTGEALVRNADFSAGSTYWYFTTDHLAPWRVENQVLEVLFDQGWVGAVVFTALIAGAIVLIASRAIREDFTYAAPAAAICGVLAVGLFSTVLFSPRLALLFDLLVLLSASLGVRRHRATV